MNSAVPHSTGRTEYWEWSTLHSGVRHPVFVIHNNPTTSFIAVLAIIHNLPLFRVSDSPVHCTWLIILHQRKVTVGGFYSPDPLQVNWFGTAFCVGGPLCEDEQIKWIWMGRLFSGYLRLHLKCPPPYSPRKKQKEVKGLYEILEIKRKRGGGKDRV